MNSVSPALTITTASNSGQARHIAVANPPSTEPSGTNSPPRTGFHRPDQGQTDSARWDEHVGHLRYRPRCPATGMHYQTIR